MPNYHYICKNCEYEFEVFQSIHENPKKRCEKCKKHKLERIIYAAMVIDKTPKTIGSWAEAENKKLGAEQVELKKKKLMEESKVPYTGPGKPLKKEKIKPWWRTSDKPLDLKTVKNVEKYIITGDKN